MNTSYYATPPRSGELYHHGIKGQKWGVRRFQQMNGTLTNAGKQRYLESLVPTSTKRPANARADRARQEAQTAHKLANAYKNKMDAKAAKRQAQAERKQQMQDEINAIKNKDITVSIGAAGRITGKTWEISGKKEQILGDFASKIGAKKIAETKAANAKYLIDSGKKMSSGYMKVAPPKTRYQKFARSLAKSSFARDAIMDSDRLSTRQKITALNERQAMIDADRQRRKEIREVKRRYKSGR